MSIYETGDLFHIAFNDFKPQFTPRANSQRQYKQH